MRRKQHLISLVITAIVMVCLGNALPSSAATAEVVIEFGRKSTPQRAVTLELTPSVGARSMRISNEPGFTDDPPWTAVRKRKQWELSHGEGVHNVYVQFRDGLQRKSKIVTDSIILTAPRTFEMDVSFNDSDGETRSRTVTIFTTSSVGIEAMAITNSGSFDGVPYRAVRKEQTWILSRGRGKKLVRIRFRDINGKTYTHQRGIYYDQPDHYLREGSLVKGSDSTVYYLGYEGRLHPFPHASVYHSYGYSFGDILEVADAKLQEYHIGSPICMRAGTWLVKFRSLPRVYSVEPGCILRPLRSEAEAYVIYGSRWAQRVVEIGAVLSSSYTVHELTEHPLADDRDRDGVSTEDEKRYGTSDKNFDSDGDGLSDGEEVLIWFTDPADVDTDDDGMTDGQEVIRRRHPGGSEVVEEIAAASYEFPRGAVVEEWWNDRKLYYITERDEHVYVSRTFTDDVFTSNRFERRFVIHPPFEFHIHPKKSSRVIEDDVFIHSPQKIFDGDVSIL